MVNNESLSVLLEPAFSRRMDTTQMNPQSPPGGQSCNRTVAPKNSTAYISSAYKPLKTKAPSLFRALGHSKQKEVIKMIIETEFSSSPEGRGLRDQLLLI